MVSIGCHRGLEPAAYKAPKVGTIYRYTGQLSNTVTGSDGWRTSFVDQNGNPGSRIGVFISESPKAPLTIAPGEMEKLWPLTLDKTAKIKATRGEEVFSWTFRVPSEEQVLIAGRHFLCYVVQAVQDPVLVKNPATAPATINTWWYSPELNAVVRFKTTYVAGRSSGTVYAAELQQIGSAGAAAQKK